MKEDLIITEMYTHVFDGWRRPVLVLVTDSGEKIMTEYFQDRKMPGLNTKVNLQIAAKNSKGYRTVIL